MTKEEIVTRVESDGVKFIALQFTDLLGVVKEIIIPSSGLKNSVNHGAWFDGSSIEGFARIQESDLFLKPDTNTYAVIPWLTENGKTARLICDIYNADGQPFSGDPRYILKRAVAEAEAAGYSYNVGPESEFYLFKKDAAGHNQPIDGRGYFDFSSHEGYKFIREVAIALGNFGIEVETSHHEVGEGQYEIDFKYGPALEIADKVLTLKYTVKKMAEMHGFVATFIPKPMMDHAGNGMHVHQSLCDKISGKNLFSGPEDKYRLTPLAYNFIAGQLKSIRGICAVLCPTVNSYKRLVSGFEAPVYVTWAGANRSSLIRVPRWFAEKSEAARIELRNPDATCNPYLAFAIMLKAGLDGIKNNLQPGEPVEENVYHFDGVTLANKGIMTLPSSLYEALQEMKNSVVAKEAFGQELLDKYVYVKEEEWNEFKLQVTPWEIEKYSDAY